MFGNGGEREQAAVEQAQLAERQRDLERVRSEAEWERKQRRRDEERRLEEVEYAALMEAAEMSLDLDPDLETDLETDLSETENEEEAESVALMEAAEAGLQLPGTVGSPSGSPMVRTQQDRAALASGSSAKGAGTSRAGRNPGGISNGGRVSPPIQAAAGLAAEEDDEDALVDELMLALMGGGLDPPVRVPGTAPSLGTAGLDPPIGVRGPGPAGPLPLRQGRAAAITGAGNSAGGAAAAASERFPPLPEFPGPGSRGAGSGATESRGMAAMADLLDADDDDLDALIAELEERLPTPAFEPSQPPPPPPPRSGRVTKSQGQRQPLATPAAFESSLPPARIESSSTVLPPHSGRVTKGRGQRQPPPATELPPPVPRGASGHVSVQPSHKSRKAAGNGGQKLPAKGASKG